MSSYPAPSSNCQCHFDNKGQSKTIYIYLRKSSMEKGRQVVFLMINFLALPRRPQCLGVLIRMRRQNDAFTRMADDTRAGRYFVSRMDVGKYGREHRRGETGQGCNAPEHVGMAGSRWGLPGELCGENAGARAGAEGRQWRNTEKAWMACCTAQIQGEERQRVKKGGGRLPGSRKPSIAHPFWGGRASTYSLTRSRAHIRRCGEWLSSGF